MEQNKNCEILYKTQIAEIKQEILKGDIKESYFSGPSIYFSKESLKCCQCEKEFLGERHIEMIYATLVAWGMHRMGEGGAKMPNFDDFKISILRNRQQFENLKSVKIENVKNWEVKDIIENMMTLIFEEGGINASTTESKIVSGTKVLAHILPDIVSPIDRNYTATYFKINKLNKQNQKNLFEIVMNTLWCVYQDKNVLKSALIYHQKYAYISLPKLFDNVIINLIKKQKISKNA